MIAKDESPVSQKTSSAALISIMCLGIAVCEWVFAYQDVTYGIVIALVLALAVYLVNPLIKLGRRFNDCVESLVLIPLYILFTSSFPWFFLSQSLLLPAVYAAVLALCAWHIYQKNISLREIGFRRGRLVKYILIGVLSGVPLGAVEYFIITPARSFPTFEFIYLLRDFAYMAIFVGLGEELLFRALVQRDMSTLFGWKWGLIAASIMFGMMHLTWGSVTEVFFTTFAGLVFGYLYHKTGTLTAPVIAHGVANTVLVAVMPYLFG